MGNVDPGIARSATSTCPSAQLFDTRQVAPWFNEIFANLSPAGRGSRQRSRLHIPPGYQSWSGVTADGQARVKCALRALTVLPGRKNRRDSTFAHTRSPQRTPEPVPRPARQPPSGRPDSNDNRARPAGIGIVAFKTGDLIATTKRRPGAASAPLPNRTPGLF